MKKTPSVNALQLLQLGHSSGHKGKKLKSCSKLKTCSIESNLRQGSYRPRFFSLERFNVQKVEVDSIDFGSGDAEKAILNGSFSFGYLREDKLRTVRVYTQEGEMLPFSRFLSNFGITLKSENLFKTGKYLNRIFRPVRFGEFFSELDIHINRNPKTQGKVTDGISLISVSLAHSLGWKKAKHGDSAQFTLLFDKGLTKGHCVVSQKIGHDVVIYGEDNIKGELSISEAIYVSVEPVRLGKTLRMDIQSLLNLWEIFGPDQYLQWAHIGIESFKRDMMNGRVGDYLDDFDGISSTEYEDERWTLKRAIWHKIDYTRYPGLIRCAWTMFKTSILRFAIDGSDNPVFRIPVPGAFRGYLRVDLRDHDIHGNFMSGRNRLTLDAQGNLWVPAGEMERVCNTLGGADQDDSICIISLNNGMSVLYRNPNQYGEVMMLPITFEKLGISVKNQMIGRMPVKCSVNTPAQVNKPSLAETGNKLLDRFLSSLQVNPQISAVPYTLQNLLKAYLKVKMNTASIGVAANAEMIRSSINITDGECFSELSNMFRWSLENIIDATVKDGIDAENDMRAVKDMVSYVHSNKIPVPQSLKGRFPKSMQSELTMALSHPLDELLQAIKYLIRLADKDVLGEGTVSRGNRVPGLIDNLDIPFFELGNSVLGSPLYDAALSIMKGYNRSLAILLENTKELPISESEAKRKEGIEHIQVRLLSELKHFTQDERAMITRVWMYEIYKSMRSVHDSILWIGEKEGSKGTAEDTIRMLANSGSAFQVISSEGLKRIKQPRQEINERKPVRLWRNGELSAEMFRGLGEMIIINGKAELGADVLNIGDECPLKEGHYTIYNIVQSTSRKNGSTFLKNSITVYVKA